MSAPKAGSPAQFTLSVAPGAEHDFARWREGVAPMFDIAPLSPTEQAAFTMETLGYFLPGLAITTTTSSPCTFMRKPELIARSGIDNILVQVYVAGSYRLTTEHSKETIEPGDIAVIDLACESKLEATSYTNFACTIQRDLLDSMLVSMQGLHGLVLRNGEPRNMLVKSHLMALHAEGSHIMASEQSAIVSGSAALIASCLEPSLRGRTEARSKLEARTKLQAIRRAIDSRLDDSNLNPEVLAKQFGISRTSIYRMFEPLGGVRNYIQQRRLMHAYQLISHPSHFGESIATIVARLGFKDASAFSHAFSSFYRMSPSDVRAAARSGFAMSTHASNSGPESFGMLNRWLLGLDANGRRIVHSDRAREQAGDL